MISLIEKMQNLFDLDSQINDYILQGKLPGNISEIAAKALSSENDSMPISLGGAPEPYQRIAQLIQMEFFPDAPPLRRDGLIDMLFNKGPAPRLTIISQIADQIIKKAREMGNDIPETEGEKMTREMKAMNHLSEIMAVK